MIQIDFSKCLNQSKGSHPSIVAVLYVVIINNIIGIHGTVSSSIINRMMMQRYYGLMILLVASNTHAFLTTTTTTTTTAPCLVVHPSRRCEFPSSTSSITSSSSHLQMAGFGAAAAAAPNNKKKNKKDVVPNKLKPKQQWDRYCSLALKASQRVRVAGRVINVDGKKEESSSSEWFEVGFVKSKEDAYTEPAVIRQRVLLAEHARRLYPLQILAKDKLEWAYYANNENEEEEVEWVVAGQVDMPEDIEKWIGFEGLPDLSGFYSSTKKTGSKDDAPIDGADKMNKKKRIGWLGMENHA